MTAVFIVLGSIACVAALALALRPYLPPAAVAYFAMWLFQWSGILYFSSTEMMTWAGAVAVSTAIDMMQDPKQKWQPLVAHAYLLAGAAIGTLVGAAIAGGIWLIPGSAIGCLLALLALARTPLGRGLALSRDSFLRYLAQVGLRAIVVTSIIGTIVVKCITWHSASQALNLL